MRLHRILAKICLPKSSRAQLEKVQETGSWEAFDNVSSGFWKFCCEHVEDAEYNYWVQDIAVEAKVEKVELLVCSSDETQLLVRVGWLVVCIKVVIITNLEQKQKSA